MKHVDRSGDKLGGLKGPGGAIPRALVTRGVHVALVGPLSSTRAPRRSESRRVDEP
eukprot:CAMPEP_0174756046 /NCGR_PEP_ID=MMETSP1094-20130205/106558_1 /TAXON_ID=156173 /ORGANISM="Chrysochromulina brevifilum, Strain UTEX LB 985" /LENGTH=55 /DNA_ID=CAMNT_0015961951 /DNA_START=752 /DNA_END=919 /DNA_ORIENTATION=+